LKEFNLPDPRERRVWEKPPPARPFAVESPRRERDISASAAQSSERTITVPRAQFEVFVPRLDGAKSLEFRAGAPRGRLLGEVDLARVP
jgi:hypothetical protein